MKVNIQALIGLIFYPLVLLTCFVLHIGAFGFSNYDLSMCLLGYYVTNISIGVGLHRLWAHNAYKTNSIVEFILCVFTAGAMQGPVLAWVSDHHYHHTLTDQVGDPHSPLRYKSKFLGFLWSHIGWMLFKHYDLKSINKFTMKKLGRNKLLIWQMKYYWRILIFMHIVPPAILGYLLYGTEYGMIAGILCIGIGRAIQQQMTFCVNSLCHFIGSKPYNKDSTARDIWWLAPLLLGENWHNFHHAFPSDYRNGPMWYQLDVHKWIIFAMYKLGIASDLDVTSQIRIVNKSNEVLSKVLLATKEEWIRLKIRSETLKAECMRKIESIEHSIDTSSSLLKKNVINNVMDLCDHLANICDQASVFIEKPEKSSKALIKKAYEKLYRFEQIIFEYRFSNAF